jgi:glucose-6-phosphate 1-dehydrogenase
VRDEKLKVIRSLEPFTPESVIADTVRGQYQAGRIDGADVPGYLDEPGIPADSHTETFVALKARINNWRWAGVPFYLRTGKRMHRQVAEIVINFYSLPHAIFPTGDSGVDTSNRLYLRLQPNEAIELHLMAKQAGDENRLKPVKLDLDLTGQGERHSGAYERLLMDVARGNQTLFVRRDESDAAWHWVMPIMKTWSALDKAPEPYAAGSNGPEAALELLRRDARRWVDGD